MIRASAPYTSRWGDFVLLKMDCIRVSMGRQFEHVTPEEENSKEPVTIQDLKLQLDIPTGNSTRLSRPNKYHTRKFQFDKLCYYSCTFCNKHFDSLHHLNKQNKKTLFDHESNSVPCPNPQIATRGQHRICHIPPMDDLPLFLGYENPCLMACLQSLC